MRITVHCYDRLGSDLVVSVTYADETGPGVPARPELFARSIVPLSGMDTDMIEDLVYAVAEEMMNMAYARTQKLRAWQPPLPGVPAR